MSLTVSKREYDQDLNRNCLNLVDAFKDLNKLVEAVQN